ncbi:MAG TPA: AraC family transcriptional regulator [Gemmatimonadales bacterium]|nr:AraC family transcriptional regulator [Gemmatimonadales bacterium]
MVRRRPTIPGPIKLRSVRTAGFVLTEGIHSGGSRLPWHHHEGPTLCFVLRGSFTETSGGERLTCTPDTLKVMPAGERHCDDFDRGDARGLLVETDFDRARYIRTHAPVLDERIAFHGGLPAALARRVYQEFRQADDAAALAIEGLLLELLAAVSRRRGENGSSRGAPWLGETRDRLHADLAARPSLTELAGAVGVHPVTLARAFRRSFGCTVGEYLRRLRIERATEQLAGGDTPLAEIALAAGFADQSHFSNVFRRRTGMSPSAFRRAARGR